MSKIEKLLARVKASPTDFTWNELVKLMSHYGYEETTKGKTAGSRRAFINPRTRQIIRLHKPHPGTILKQYQLKDVLDVLDINE